MRKASKLIRNAVLPVIRRVPVIGDSFRASSGYYETLDAWIAASGSQSQLQPVHAAFEVRRSKPTRIAEGVTVDLQAGVPPYETYMERPSTIAHFEGGFVCTDACEIMTPDRALLGDLLFNDVEVKHKLIKTEHLSMRPPTVRKTGSYATIYSYFSHNYAFWLLDTLTRLWVLESGGIDPSAKLIMPHNLPDYQYRSLEILGYPRERLELFDGSCWQCDHLYVPSFTNLRFWLPNPNAARWLRDRLLAAVTPPNPDQPTRLFVNRAPSNNRRLLNRDALMGALTPLGFVEVIPQGMSLDEQIRLFSGAEVMVSPFGAGLANMLFMRDGAKIVEMVGSQRRNRHYTNLAAALGMPHAYVTREGLHDEYSRDKWNEDYEAPVERVRIALDALGIS